MLGISSNKQRGLLFHIVDVTLNIIIIVAIVVAVRTLLISPFQVEGSSMSNTLEHRQYIIINKLAYHLGEPERGDVVVFRPPHDNKKYYVKRILGVPGDTVIIKNGWVYIKNKQNPVALKIIEPYLNGDNAGQTFRLPPDSDKRLEISYTVPEGGYFLLGDNRQGSVDSRSFGPAGREDLAFVPEKNIKGRVWFIALPISQAHALEPPNYGL